MNRVTGTIKGGNLVTVTSRGSNLSHLQAPQVGRDCGRCSDVAALACPRPGSRSWRLRGCGCSACEVSLRPRRTWRWAGCRRYECWAGDSPLGTMKATSRPCWVSGGAGNSGDGLCRLRPWRPLLPLPRPLPRNRKKKKSFPLPPEWGSRRVHLLRKGRDCACWAAAACQGSCRRPWWRWWACCCCRCCCYQRCC